MTLSDYVPIEWIDLCQSEDCEFSLEQRAPTPIAERAVLLGFDFNALYEFTKLTHPNRK